MPYEVVAGGDRLGGGAAVVQSKVDCYGAVTSGGVGERVSSSAVIGGISVAVNPGITVTMVLRIGTHSAVADGKVECYCAVASGGVGERVGGSVIRGGIGSTIDPSIVVAMVLRIGTRSAVADGEVECDGAIASGGVGEGVSSRAVIGGICVAVNPGIAIAVVL